MDLYLIEVRDMDEQFRTIRKGVRASLETAESLVDELCEEYIKKDYTIVNNHDVTNHSFSSFKALTWNLWSNNGNHDLDICLSSGWMDTNEHRLWIDNEDEGKMFESNEEMTEYLINNYES